MSKIPFYIKTCYYYRISSSRGLILKVSRKKYNLSFNKIKINWDSAQFTQWWIIACSFFEFKYWFTISSMNFSINRLFFKTKIIMLFINFLCSKYSPVRKEEVIYKPNFNNKAYNWANKSVTYFTRHVVRYNCVKMEKNIS